MALLCMNSPTPGWAAQVEVECLTVAGLGQRASDDTQDSGEHCGCGPFREGPSETKGHKPPWSAAELGSKWGSRAFLSHQHRTRGGPWACSSDMAPWDQLLERICTSCLSNLFPFSPSLVTTRGQMEILTSDRIPENENACGKSALSLWLRPCASFACPPGLHNLLILWHPTVLEVAHLYFQQILPMV